MRGTFICLEGIDNSGKTGQCEMLARWIRDAKGVACETIAFPDRRSATGRAIEAYLTGKERADDRAAHLLFAANRWERADEMRRLLESGTTLVVDRYSFSGIAYSAAKGLAIDWCAASEVGLPCPDVVAYLSITADEGERRAAVAKKARECHDVLELQKKVAAVYTGSLYGRGGCAWKTVAAQNAFEDVTDQIRRIASEAMARSASTALPAIEWIPIAAVPFLY